MGNKYLILSPNYASKNVLEKVAQKNDLMSKYGKNIFPKVRSL